MIYIKLFLVFAKIGVFGFGGGVAMLPMIYQSAKAFQLMSADEFSNLVAISQVTPGPIAVNAATYVGYNCAGFTGAFVATAGVAVPSFVMVTLAYMFITKFKDSKTIDGAFYGIRPVTAGLLASAVVFIGQSAFATISPVTLAIFVGTVIAAASKKVSPILIILVAGVLGALLCR